MSSGAVAFESGFDGIRFFLLFEAKIDTSSFPFCPADVYNCIHATSRHLLKQAFQTCQAGNINVISYFDGLGSSKSKISLPTFALQ